MRQTVLLRSDMSGEDEAYTICAVEIDTSKIDLAELQQRATAMMDKIREQDEYCDSELVEALEQAGFTVVNPPEEIIVRE